MALVTLNFLDIETTGLDQEKGHRVIEFACEIYRLDTDTKQYERRGAFEKRINPQRPIDPAAQAVHGICFEELDGCPTIEEVMPTIGSLISVSKYTVSHNGNGFDCPFITLEAIRIGQPLKPFKNIDTMLDGRWSTPNGKLPNLGELAFACGIPYDKSKAHAALYDVQIMAACFFHGYQKGFFILPE